MVGSNMIGSEKLKLVILINQNPFCFKDIKFFAVDYETSRKLFISIEIDEKWLDEKLFVRRGIFYCLLINVLHTQII